MSQDLFVIRETQVLCKLIYDIGFRTEVLTFLEAKDFVEPNSQSIFRAIKKLTAQKRPVDVLTIQEVDPDVEVPEKSFLDESVDHLEQAKVVKRLGNQQRILNAVREFLEESAKDGFSFDRGTEKLVTDIQSPISHSVGGVAGSAVMEQFLEKVGQDGVEVVGNTGITKLDELTQGLETGHVYTFVAPSGVGKTMMGVQIFHESMKLGTPSLYLSNEMSTFEIVSRILARMANVTSLEIRRNKVPQPDTKLYSESIGELDELIQSTNSVILENAHDPSKAFRAIRYHVLKQGVKLVVVDHLHNFRGKGELYERVSYISHSLQQLAQELNIALVILGQISLESQKIKNMENVTAKGAKDLEEVSNVFCILKRKKVASSVHFVAKDEDPRYVKIMVTKNRDGNTGQTYGFVKFPSMIISDDTSNGA